MGSGGSVSYVLQVILQRHFMQMMHSCESGIYKVDLKSFGTCDITKPPFDDLSAIQEVYSFLFSVFKPHTELIIVYMAAILSLITVAGNRLKSPSTCIDFIPTTTWMEQAFISTYTRFTLESVSCAVTGLL